jgi:hypothetical protein
MSAEAESLLARVAAAYAACRTYRDEGVATTTFIGTSLHRTERRPFSTRFVRPGGFLFEYRRRRCEDHWEQYATWMDGARVRTWCRILDDRQPTTSLRSALAAAAGWTSGVADRVPLLLMPGLGENHWLESVRRSARIVEAPEAAGHGCVVVESPGVPGRIEQVWIDRSSLLIRRIVVPRFVLELSPSESSGEGAAPARGVTAGRSEARRPEIEEAITYEPAFDAEIEPGELRFVPPPSPPG